MQLQLQLLREWLIRMETKVPKLVVRPKWTRETLDRRIVEYKVSFSTARWRREKEKRSTDLKNEHQMASYGPCGFPTIFENGKTRN